MVVDELVTHYAQNFVDGISDFVGQADFESGSYFARCEACDLYHTCYDVHITHIPTQGTDKCTICQDCIYKSEYGDTE